MRGNQRRVFFFLFFGKESEKLSKGEGELVWMALTSDFQYERVTR